MEDVVPGDAYLLEVSSPGLDRKLTKPADYERFKGSLIKVTTYEPVEGNRNFRGRLEANCGRQIHHRGGNCREEEDEEEARRGRWKQGRD